MVSIVPIRTQDVVSQRLLLSNLHVQPRYAGTAGMWKGLSNKHEVPIQRVVLKRITNLSQHATACPIHHLPWEVNKAHSAIRKTTEWTIHVMWLLCSHLFKFARLNVMRQGLNTQTRTSVQMAMPFSFSSCPGHITFSLTLLADLDVIQNMALYLDVIQTMWWILKDCINNKCNVFMSDFHAMFLCLILSTCILAGRQGRIPCVIGHPG